MQSRSEQPVMRERRRRCLEELRLSCPMRPSLPSVLRQGRLAHLLDTSAYNADRCCCACASHPRPALFGISFKVGGSRWMLTLQ